MGDSVRRSSLPAGLMVGAVMTAVCFIASTLGTYYDRFRPRWTITYEAGIVAGASLMCVGALALARRLDRRSATAAHVAAFGFAAWAASRVIFVIAMATLKSDERIASIGTDAMLAGCGALSVASVALAIAAGLARNAVVPVAAAGAAFVVCLPWQAYSRLLAATSASTVTWILVAGVAAWAALIVAISWRAVRSAAEAPEDQQSAIIGFKRASAGLWIQLGAATVLVTLASDELVGLVPYMRLVHAGVGAVAMVVFASGLVRVARASGTVLPTMRLSLATFLVAFAAGAQTIYALGVYTWISTSHAWGSLGPAWPLLTPIIAAVGIFVLLWAIRQLAIASGDDKLHRAASATLTVYPILMGLSIALLAGASSRQWGSILLSLSTTLTVGGCVLAASLCSKAAQAIEARPALATATLRPPDTH